MKYSFLAVKLMTSVAALALLIPAAAQGYTPVVITTTTIRGNAISTTSPGRPIYGTVAGTTQPGVRDVSGVRRVGGFVASTTVRRWQVPSGPLARPARFVGGIDSRRAYGSARANGFMAPRDPRAVAWTSRGDARVAVDNGRWPRMTYHAPQANGASRAVFTAVRVPGGIVVRNFVTRQQYLRVLVDGRPRFYALNAQGLAGRAVRGAEVFRGAHAPEVARWQSAAETEDSLVAANHMAPGH